MRWIVKGRTLTVSVGIALVLCFSESTLVERASALPAGLLVGQSDAPATRQRPTSTPYAGDLSIFEYPDRDQRLHVDRVMDLLEIAPGKSVADVGAGSGWFTVRAAARVGSAGTVYAEDINPQAIDYITKRAADQKLENIKPILGSADDTKLPTTSVDAVLILKTYHEFAHPVPLMAKLKLALKPGAKVGIIDRNGDGTNHGIMPEVVEREMTRAGFKRAGKYDFTKDDGQDYFLIFSAK